MTQLIRLEGEIVATVGATRFFLSPAIEALPEDDPIARLVTVMCAYALEVHAGELEGPYSDAAALEHARSVLQEL